MERSKLDKKHYIMVYIFENEFKNLFALLFRRHRLQVVELNELFCVILLYLSITR